MAKINILNSQSLKPLPEIKETPAKKVIDNLFTPERSKLILNVLGDKLESLAELRIRRGQVILGRCPKQEYIVPQTVQKEEMEYILQRLNQSSLYAWEEEYRKGYLTIAGGHRVGLAGKAMLQRGEIRALKDINSLNIRFARNVYGAAEKIMPYIAQKNKLANTLLIGPPASGKTTVLREIIRLLSDEFGYQISVVDERSELSGMYEGESHLNLGSRVDVLDGCPKALGMNMLIRSMAPEVLATDELGTKEDVQALEEALAAGVKVITTIHGQSMEDLRNKAALANVLLKHMFETIIILSKNQGPGSIQEVYQWQGDGYERVRANEMVRRDFNSRSLGQQRLDLC